MAGQLTHCAIELLYDKREDGRFRIHSPDLPGLNLIGPDMAALVADLETVLRDMLPLITNQAVEALQTIPSLQSVTGYAPPGTKRELRLVTFKRKG